MLPPTSGTRKPPCVLNPVGGGVAEELTNGSPAAGGVLDRGGSAVVVAGGGGGLKVGVVGLAKTWPPCWVSWFCELVLSGTNTSDPEARVDVAAGAASPRAVPSWLRSSEASH